MPPPNYTTPNGLQRLREEITWLEKEERPRIVAEVQYAASMGDRSENAEYIYGKKRLRKIDGRRRHLMKRLECVRPVDPGKMSGDTVKFGATVILEDEEGEQKTWRIYGMDEVNIDAGILSWVSPISTAILGKRVGDVVTFRAPGGMREIEIIDFCYEAQVPLENLTFRL